MKEKLRSTINKVLPPLAALLLIFLAWYCICAFGSVPKYMAAALAEAIGTTVNKLSTIRIDNKILTGFLMAVIMDKISLVRKMLYPLIVISQTIPTIAIAPLLVIWLGYQMLPKIILIVLVVFFPIAISLLEGFASVDADTVNLMRTMGASDIQIFRYVKLPNSLGQFFSSLKISVSYAVVSAVVSEWIGGTEGLGCYMTRVRKSFSSDKMFAVIILISVLSLLLIWLTHIIQHACMPWDKINQKRRNQ